MPWVKMSIGTKEDAEEWDSRPIESLDEGFSTELDTALPLRGDTLKRVQASGWLKQQALLRERKLNPKGTPVKQRLFRSDQLTENSSLCLIPESNTIRILACSQLSKSG